MILDIFLFLKHGTMMKIIVHFHDLSHRFTGLRTALLLSFIHHFKYHLTKIHFMDKA